MLNEAKHLALDSDSPPFDFMTRPDKTFHTPCPAWDGVIHFYR